MAVDRNTELRLGTLVQAARGELRVTEIQLSAPLTDPVDFEAKVRRLEQFATDSVSKLQVVPIRLREYKQLLESDGVSAGRVVGEESIVIDEGIEIWQARTVESEIIQIPTYRWRLRWNQADQNGLPVPRVLRAYLQTDGNVLIHGERPGNASMDQPKRIGALLDKAFIALNSLSDLGDYGSAPIGMPPMPEFRAPKLAKEFEYDPRQD